MTALQASNLVIGFPDWVVDHYLYLVSVVEPEWAGAWLRTVLDPGRACTLEGITKRAAEIDAGAGYG